MKPGKGLRRSGFLRRSLTALKRSPLSRVGRRAKKEQEALEAGRRACLEDAYYMCARCKHTDRALDVHHRLPRSRGGTHDVENLAALCRPCHKRIHDHMALDWKDWIR